MPKKFSEKLRAGKSVCEKYLKKFQRFITGSRNCLVNPKQDRFIYSIVKQAREYLKKHPVSTQSRILYVSGYYNVKFPRIFDSTIATALMLRGAEIRPAITGHFYPKQDIVFGGIYTGDRPRQVKRFYFFEKKVWLDLLKTNPFYLCNYRKPEDIELSENLAKQVNFQNCKEFMYQDYPAGYQAMLATINLNNLPQKFPEQPEYLEQLQIHVANIIQLYLAYNRILLEYKPTAMISDFPFYYKWGLVIHLCKKHGIPAYSIGTSERKNAFFCSSNSSAVLDSSPAWPTFSQQTISEETMKLLEEGFAKRAQGKASHFSPYPQAFRQTPDYLEFEKKIDKKRPIVFFPINVAYDIAAFQNSTVFSGLIDMLQQVTAYFNQHPEYQLILKAHPAEKFFYSFKDQRYSQYCTRSILSQYKLNDNIIFLDYNTEISTHDIIPIANLAIAFSSSATMEMTWHGKPVITVAKAHYSNKGLAYEPNSVEEFFAILNKVLSEGESSETIQKRIECAKKYYLLYYYHSQIDFGLFQGSNFEGLVEEKYTFQKLEDLLPGANKALDYFCDSVIQQLPIHGDNRWPPATFR